MDKEVGSCHSVLMHNTSPGSKRQRMTWQEKDVTLFSPCTGRGNNLPRKGHSRGEQFPPVSNSVGLEIERAWGNFTINQSSASLLRKQREAGSQMTNPFFFTELELLAGCDARSEGNPREDTCTAAARRSLSSEFKRTFQAGNVCN